MRWNNPIFDDIRDRVFRRNENVLILVTGKGGSGKSYTMLRWSELLDKDFNLSRLAFDHKQFLELLTQEERIPRGAVIVWDEVGTGISADKWFSDINVAVRKIFRLFRYRNLIVFIAAPNEMWVDSKVRGLFHAEISCHSSLKRRDKERSRGTTYNWVKFRWLEFHPFKNRVYRIPHYGSGTMLDMIATYPPSTKLRNAYEKLHRKRKDAEINQLKKDLANVY